MKKQFLLSVFLRMCLIFALASILPPALAASRVRLENPRIDIQDQQSIKRGARLYKQHCLVCHSLKYLRYNHVAKSAGIIWKAMPVENETWTFGIAPPDLSMVTRYRGARWVYTYLHSFYEDGARPTGNNNLVMPNTSMPNLFLKLQGRQVLMPDRIHLIGYTGKPPRWFNVLRLEQEGEMSPTEFDQFTLDLVHFLVYAGEPARAERESLGKWVLGFLLILLVLAYLLKAAYWRK